MLIHIVAPGETIYLLARTYSIPVQRIISDNGLMYPYFLAVEQALIITQPAQIHTVKEGETPYSIAKERGISVQELYQNNPELSFGAPLFANQILVIRFRAQKTRPLSTNGYAYPHVNRHLLRRTLPFLSYLSIFSYGMREDASLIPVEDSELLAYARSYHVLPVLVLTSLDENGTFSSSLLQKLLQNTSFQNTILDQLIQIMLEKGYRGLDSDFEYIPREDATAYISFLENARDRLHKNGLFLHCALAPKTEANQLGLLYEGHNYREIGAVSDRVSLMTDEWSYTYVCTCYLQSIQAL